MNRIIMANTMNCVIISKKRYELYTTRVGIIIAQRNVLAMKRPVPIYDFTAFGKAIKEARTKRGESRKNVSDDMIYRPAILQTLRTKDNSRACKSFMSLLPVTIYP